jgi:hypothetical protein
MIDPIDLAGATLQAELWASPDQLSPPQQPQTTTE